MMANESDISDTVFAALVVRRELLREGEGAKAIRILGSRFEPRARELEGFAKRRRLPHVWIDLDDPDIGDVDVLLASVGVRPADTPVVITPTAVLRRPTVGELAQNLGVTYHAAPGRVPRPRGHRRRAGRAGRRRVRRVGGTRHARARRRWRRWAGRREQQDRELLRLPERTGGRPAHRGGRTAGAPAGRDDQRAMRGHIDGGGRRSLRAHAERW